MITDEWGNKVYQDEEIEMPIEQSGTDVRAPLRKKKSRR